MMPAQLGAYEAIARRNYDVIRKSGITNDSLSSYFSESFNSICRAAALYKCWACVRCMELNKFSYGWGNKPKVCPVCNEKTIYEVATFQGRASYVGEMFEWACWLLLKEAYGITARTTSDSTRLYDLELRPDVVIEAKGSPKYIINPDGSRSHLGRAGMMRTDTEKKAFANAKKWHARFPNGHFFILTNALPNKLLAYRNETVKAIYDITKKSQLEKFVDDLKEIGIP